MADKVTWFELPADDTARAGAFYATVFGWDTPDMGGGSMMAITTPSDEEGAPLAAGAINGDISPRSQAFDKPLIVITVEDIEAKIKAVEAAGGKVALAPEKMEGMDLIWAIITDTEGNNIGVVQEV
ncbi:MAG TPA: VOC family protein [Verrucomicrobiae bacterium]|nr:VOC family protein [Verrucomicrobiae bacterium]